MLRPRTYQSSKDLCKELCEVEGSAKRVTDELKVLRRQVVVCRVLYSVPSCQPFGIRGNSGLTKRRFAKL